MLGMVFLLLFAHYWV